MSCARQPNVQLLASGNGSDTILVGQLTSKTPIKTATKPAIKTGVSFSAKRAAPNMAATIGFKFMYTAT